MTCDGVRGRQKKKGRERQQMMERQCQRRLTRRMGVWRYDRCQLDEYEKQGQKGSQGTSTVIDTWATTAGRRGLSLILCVCVCCCPGLTKDGIPMVRKQECWPGYLCRLRVAGFHGTDQIGRRRETIGACHLLPALE
ncbi:hypothetical protein LX32DRAFT_260051 [Colletotrichum zoysiae]|uniref:Uncharacterized protein n=1 Tax=Colletotrichum zoysiae TaxID=1216348 RepID=A0AAD9H359_9PEZI|nr:hypothetical protein LX32DRAFT_260051 [Colletotrichum zoysiae]